jgi:hypothetical protein
VANTVMGSLKNQVKVDGEISLLGLGVLLDLESEFGWEAAEGCDGTGLRT